MFTPPKHLFYTPQFQIPKNNPAQMSNQFYLVAYILPGWLQAKAFPRKKRILLIPLDIEIYST